MPKYYAYIKENRINGSGCCECLNEGIINLEISESVFNEIDKYKYEDGELVVNPNYEKEKHKRERTEEILKRLQELDSKSIRAIRANDTEYIQRYEEEAISLREELHSLSED